MHVKVWWPVDARAGAGEPDLSAPSLPVDGLRMIGLRVARTGPAAAIDAMDWAALAALDCQLRRMQVVYWPQGAGLPSRTGAPPGRLAAGGRAAR